MSITWSIVSNAFICIVEINVSVIVKYVIGCFIVNCGKSFFDGFFDEFIGKFISQKEFSYRIEISLDLHISKADKGNVTVIMNKSEYIDKVETALKDIKYYKYLPKKPLGKLQKSMKSLILDWEKREFLK